MHIVIRDAQTSLSLLTPPLISYAEVSVTMPAPTSLWRARTSQEWKDLYLATYTQNSVSLPSFRTFMDDPCSMFDFQTLIDTQVSALSILCGLWSLSWQYRERKSLLQLPSSTQSRNSALIAKSHYQDTLNILGHFELAMSDLPVDIQPVTLIFFQQQLMSLHVSLEDVQLLAGKAGEKEARRVLPLLVTWAQGQESRQALWHAGQILRTVMVNSMIVYYGASAVAVYHASLVFWAYSIVLRSSLASEAAQRQDLPLSNGHIRPQLKLDHVDEGQVDLCGEKGVASQRFIALGKGRPAIQKSTFPPPAGYSNEDKSLVPLSDTSAVMTEIIQLLRRSYSTERQSDECSPLVENLARLMKKLGNAASGIHLR